MTSTVSVVEVVADTLSIAFGHNISVVSRDDVAFGIEVFAASYQPYYELDFGPVSVGVSMSCFEFIDAHVDRFERRREQRGLTASYFGATTGHRPATSLRCENATILLEGEVSSRHLTNAATLTALYLINRYHADPERAWSFVAAVVPAHRILPFHDASPYDDHFRLTPLDVCRGFARAKSLWGWYLSPDFDAARYFAMEEGANGDRTWIVPGRLMATSSPGDFSTDVDGLARSLAEDGVNTLIALNADCAYDPASFFACGIRHYSLPFDDGGCPPDGVVRSFLSITLHPSRVTAVHCKAGLGRTGTLACVFMMAEYGMQPREAIAWCRLCRPGSVIGPQQWYVQRFLHSAIRGVAPQTEHRRDTAVAASLPALRSPLYFRRQTHQPFL